MQIINIYNFLLVLLLAEKNLVELRIGQPGDRFSYWLTEGKRHGKSGNVLDSLAIRPLETTTEPYWAQQYVNLLDGQYRSILGIELSKPSKKSTIAFQLPLLSSVDIPTAKIVWQKHWEFTATLIRRSVI